MDLDALHAVVSDELFPNRINRRDIRQQGQQVFDLGDFPKRFLVRKSQTIHLGRSGGEAPKLSEF